MSAAQSGNTNGHLPTASPTASAASAPRHKQARVRSPGNGTTNEANDASSADVRPPPKRARKAINCEPCRNSKLKCDSLADFISSLSSAFQKSAVLLLCAQRRAPLDPALEFARIRQSLSLIESHVYQHNPPSRQSAHGYTSEALRRSSYIPSQGPYDRHTPDTDGGASVQGKREDAEVTSTPGMLGRQASGGLYAGPTSAVSHLISVSDRDDSDNNDRPSSPSSPPLTNCTSVDGGEHSVNVTSGSTGVWDHDLIAALPPVPIIDGLVQYYFEYCNWIYRHVNEAWLLAAWDRYKSGKHGDRIALATICILIALAARYLPPRHTLLQGVNETPEDLGSKCYGVMRDALQRFRDDAASPGRSYSLELVELLLVRCHYLTFAKEDPEETWSVRGELVTIGTAMGLHRDPGSTRFEKSVAERRRWAWWHIILLERWQAFMFGRPIAIASHHFNTQLPSYCDPAVDKSGRLYLPNLALFRLAYILGDIMDDAVSFRTVQYSAVQERDRQLTDWYDSLPAELDLDEFRIARSLASPITAVRRIGVQSVIIRTAYHHIRFTLHRPYAAKVPESLDVAVSAAAQLITLVGQTRPDFLSNSALAVPGHMNWGPFHVFSAAMFFSFQLITKPDQPAASLFRENIRKAMASLEQSRWMPVADKALTILQALAPLYSDELLELAREERERRKAQVLSLVRTLAFPYQDAPYSRSADSPGYNRYSGSSSSAAVALSSQGARPGSHHNHAEPVSMHHTAMQAHGAPATQAPVSATRWTSQSQPELSSHQHYPQQHLQQHHHQQQQQEQNAAYAQNHRGSTASMPASQSQPHHAQPYSPTTPSGLTVTASHSFPTARYAPTGGQQQSEAMHPPRHHFVHQQPQVVHDASQGQRHGLGHGMAPSHDLAYVHPADESSMVGRVDRVRALGVELVRGRDAAPGQFREHDGAGPDALKAWGGGRCGAFGTLACPASFFGSSKIRLRALGAMAAAAAAAAALSSHTDPLSRLCSVESVSHGVSPSYVYLPRPPARV
ncbi:hypothetical protein BN946_scf185043.g194 [Trametes cinnabarina]|uniref:Xylanolytic transcriptional activator regulatory domain-containing protein n=1 Tax=Pycnoporus cinnabarinus TaxID=5643 RepID=A0A060SPI3_PYCCI|nr:hypothetical protein BN946_scf185043.g194 [Trametes cinnabarina]